MVRGQVSSCRETADVRVDIGKSVDSFRSESQSKILLTPCLSSSYHVCCHFFTLKPELLVPLSHLVFLQHRVDQESDLEPFLRCELNTRRHGESSEESSKRAPKQTKVQNETIT